MIFEIEKRIKEALFNCQTCGQCILTHTRLICPMNCPKGLRNGPCGGTLDGKCEVLPDVDCVWTRIEKKKSSKKYKIHLPPDPKLFDTASYVNFFNGKDRDTRLPHDFVDTSRLPASSELSRKMMRGDFVVTLEVASPLKPEGLSRVEKIMDRVANHVDAVNTTTNAGGIPSVHSTVTAKIVREHGVEAIIQFCGRDHHKDDFLRVFEQAMQMGYRNFLFLTGDWLPERERGIDKANWFPMDSSQMVHFVNARLARIQQEHGEVPYLGVATNPFSTPMNISVDRLRFKREAGARFCQTQAITHVATYSEWYKQVRQDRHKEPKLTIPSIPLVGSKRAFKVLCRLPGVYVDPLLHEIMEHDDFQRRALDWAFTIAEGVTENGAAGVHAMNFGMPPHLIDEFLMQIRDRAEDARNRARRSLQSL